MVRGERLAPPGGDARSWLRREPAFLHEHEPEHHLEELALMTVAAEWLKLRVRRGTTSREGRWLP
jgi:hypothetical protein